MNKQHCQIFINFSSSYNILENTQYLYLLKLNSVFEKSSFKRKEIESEFLLDHHPQYIFA